MDERSRGRVPRALQTAPRSENQLREGHGNVPRTAKLSRRAGAATSEQVHQANSKTALDGHGRRGCESADRTGAVRRRAYRQRANGIARDWWRWQMATSTGIRRICVLAGKQSVMDKLRVAQEVNPNTLNQSAFSALAGLPTRLGWQITEYALRRKRANARKLERPRAIVPSFAQQGARIVQKKAPSPSWEMARRRRHDRSSRAALS